MAVVSLDSSRMSNLPNFLTLIRIVAIPFFLVLLSSRLYLEALVVFILVGLTDALDGAVLALLYNPQFMDPWMRDTLIFATASTTVISGFQYIYRGLVWLQNRAPSLTRLS